MTLEEVINDIDASIGRINLAEVAQLLTPASETGGPWTVSKWNYEGGRKAALLKVRTVLLDVHIRTWSAPKNGNQECPLQECPNGHGKTKAS